MDDSTKFQVNMILEKFNKMKHDYKEAKDEIDLFKKHLSKREQQKCTLMSMLKQKVIENKEKMETLQNEINYLKATVVDQDILIEEYLNTIDKLKKENNYLKKNKETNSPKRMSPSTNAIQKGIKQDGKHIDKLNLTHPSFDNEAKVIKKKQKKAKQPSQSCWSSLDITVSTGDDSENIVHAVSSTTDKCKILRLPRKRKLYSVDNDLLVDLE